jgi:hypothetical protein
VAHDTIEGWYLDPFGVHEARWFSDGAPTALVRDKDGAESNEAPPSTTFQGDLQPVPEPAAADGEDLLRADEENPADHIFDPNAATALVRDTFEDSSGGD